jgi:hypothetical protein
MWVPDLNAKIPGQDNCMTKPKAPPSARAQGGPARGGEAADLSEHIGRELRAMFEDVVAEPVPEKFRKLLDELEQKLPKR